LIRAVHAHVINKKSPVFFQDRGLIGDINPHNILTPKTVRGHPDRSSGSPTSASLPNHGMRDQWPELTEIETLLVGRAGITAAGPLPIQTGFPSPGCDRALCWL